MTVTWILFSAMVCLVLLVRQVAQPWRGIIDVGVIFGLVWGLVALAIFAVKAFLSKGSAVDPELAPTLAS